MAFQRHFRLVYSGTLGPDTAPVEEWSFGLALNVGEDLTIPTIGMMEGYAADLAGRFDVLLPRLSGAVRVRRCRVAAIGVDGKYLRYESGQYVLADQVRNVVGTSSGSSPWPQTALVCSLRSAMDDLTGRGRFYLPMPVASMGADLRISAADQTALVALLKTFVDGVNTTADANVGIGRVCIASQGSTVRGIPPQNRPVVEVGVGRVMDTIRSRRAQLLEEHTYSPVA